MLHNTLTDAEWANLWEGKIIKRVSQYRMVIKTATIAQVIIILRTFVLENLIFVISVL